MTRPITAPVLSTSTAPDPAVDTRTLVWIMPCIDVPRSSSTRRSRALISPTETFGEPALPGMHSMAMVGSPSWSEVSDARTAVLSCSRSTLTTATSVARSTPTTTAGSTVPS